MPLGLFLGTQLDASCFALFVYSTNLRLWKRRSRYLDILLVTEDGGNFASPEDLLVCIGPDKRDYIEKNEGG
jgi:hypothetical protein